MRLGDAAATVFQPIARGIDATFGTDLQNCAGCKGRQARLNQISDEIFTLLSWRAKSNDNSPMDYTVTKQVTAQFVIVGAADPDDAIERAQKGEGQRSSGGQSWNATVRIQTPQPPILGPGAALGIPQHGR
jgi:hypothetical protein